MLSFDFFTDPSNGKKCPMSGCKKALLSIGSIAVVMVIVAVVLIFTLQPKQSDGKKTSGTGNYIASIY